MNRQYPQGCIVERYIVEEAAEFFANYLSNVEAIGLPKVRDLDGDLHGRGTLGYKVVTIQHERHWNPARLYVLHNIEEVQSYVVEHMTYERTNNPRKSEYWIAKEHNKTFIEWFKTRVAQQLMSGEEVSTTLKVLHRGPKFQVLSYSGFVINNCTFHTKALSDKCKTHNCGVSLEAQAMHISSAKDKNPTYANSSYYGIIDKIWVLLYSHDVKIPVFYCTWVDCKNGVETNQMGFTYVDLNKVGHEVEPFILASQVTQIFYVPDLIDSMRSIVMSTPKRSSDDEDINYVCEESNNSSPSLFPNEDNANENEIYVREGHQEGIWLSEEIKIEEDSSSHILQENEAK